MFFLKIIHRCNYTIRFQRRIIFIRNFVKKIDFFNCFIYFAYQKYLVNITIPTTTIFVDICDSAKNFFRFLINI